MPIHLCHVIVDARPGESEKLNNNEDVGGKATEDSRPFYLLAVSSSGHCAGNFGVTNVYDADQHPLSPERVPIAIYHFE